MRLRYPHIIAILFTLLFLGRQLSGVADANLNFYTWQQAEETPVEEGEGNAGDAEQEVKEVLVTEEFAASADSLHWQEHSSKYPPYILSGYHDHKTAVITPPPQFS